MLFWEALTLPRETSSEFEIQQPIVLCAQRLPYDKRCAVVTKSGKRCRGRIRAGTDHCPLHDPAVVSRRRPPSASKRLRAHRRLSHLPDGYLRKLTNRASIGNAMDRLYRELRLGIVTDEMGSVLFGILTRLLDSGLADSGKLIKTGSRTKASRLRPKLSDILTRSERAAWRRAVDNAPPSILQAYDNQSSKLPPGVKFSGVEHSVASDRPVTIALQAAS